MMLSTDNDVNAAVKIDKLLQEVAVHLRGMTHTKHLRRDFRLAFSRWGLPGSYCNVGEVPLSFTDSITARKAAWTAFNKAKADL